MVVVHALDGESCVSEEVTDVHGYPTENPDLSQHVP